MNPYKNLLFKVRALLKEDDTLTKAQCEMFQWQLLAKIGDYTFTVGKGSVNTIFYTASSTQRAVCYPDEILTQLEALSKRRQIFVYVALDKQKEVLGYSSDLILAKGFKGAKYLSGVTFKGNRIPLEKKILNVFDKWDWQPVRTTPSDP